MCFVISSTSIVIFLPFTGASRRERQGLIMTTIVQKFKFTITITYLNHVTFYNYSNTCRSCIFHIFNIVCPFASIDNGVWHVSWNYECLLER